MTEPSVAGLSIKGFGDGLENRETLLEDLNREDIDQSITPLQGSRPKTSYQNIDWVRWEEEKQNVEHSTSSYRARRVPDQYYTFHRINQIFNCEMRAGQWEALQMLMFRRIDVIVIAKTGFGKSLIFQSAPFLTGDGRELGISLIIMPLKAIQAGQKKGIKEEFGGKGCILDGDSNTQARRRRCGNGEYTHSKYSFPIVNPLKAEKPTVLTSPEIAVTKDIQQFI